MATSAMISRAMSIVKTVAPATLMCSGERVVDREQLRAEQAPARMSRMMKTPTVTVAAEKAGLPTMGRSATRSITMRMIAIHGHPQGTDSQEGQPDRIAE